MKTTLAVALILLAVARADAQTARPRLTRAAFGSLPMHFEPNLGQAAGPARFLARGDGYALLLGPDAAVLVLGHDRARTVGSSRVDLQACKLEYSIVSPK